MLVCSSADKETEGKKEAKHMTICSISMRICAPPALRYSKKFVIDGEEIHGAAVVWIDVAEMRADG